MSLSTSLRRLVPVQIIKHINYVCQTLSSDIRNDECRSEAEECISVWICNNKRSTLPYSPSLFFFSSCFVKIILSIEYQQHIFLNFKACSLQWSRYVDTYKLSIYLTSFVHLPLSDIQTITFRPSGLNVKLCPKLLSLLNRIKKLKVQHFVDSVLFFKCWVFLVQWWYWRHKKNLSAGPRGRFSCKNCPCRWHSTAKISCANQYRISRIISRNHRTHGRKKQQHQKYNKKWTSPWACCLVILEFFVRV